MGLSLGLTLRISAQASFCLEFPDVYSLTQPNKTLAGVATYPRKDGGQAPIWGTGQVAWSQAGSKLVGKGVAGSSTEASAPASALALLGAR